MKKYKNRYEVASRLLDPYVLKENKERYPKKVIEGPVEDFGCIFEQGVHYAFLGHSSVYLNLSGKVILIDPIFSKHVGPFGLIGPSRFKGERITSKLFNEIDAILITHNHYDHMDIPTLRALENKTKHFIVPLGNRNFLGLCGIPKNKIIELNWEESFEMEDVKIVSMPAHHNSTRILIDYDRSLWCSYVIENKECRIFHSGDSAYSPHFKDIANQYPDFDLVFMECGQYNRRWHDMHMFPEESIQACLDLKGRFCIPIHWGAYCISLHSWNEPIIRYEKLAKEKGIHYSIPSINHIEHLKNREYL